MTRKTAKKIIEEAYKDIPYIFNVKSLIIDTYYNYYTVIWDGHDMCFDIIPLPGETRVVRYEIIEGEYNKLDERSLTE